MAKVKYYAKENSTIGTHSFYAVPIPNGTLTFDELLDEAMDGKSVEPSIAKACVTEFMKAVKRNVLKGFRCQPGCTTTDAITPTTCRTVAGAYPFTTAHTDRL